MLAASGGVAAAVAAGSTITGQVWGLVGGGVGLLAATALSNHLGCDDPPNPNVPNYGDYDGCWEVNDPGCMNIIRISPDGSESLYVTARKWLGSTLVEPYPNGTPKQINRYIDCDGVTKEDDEDGRDRYRGVPQEGSTCAGDQPPPLPPIPPVPVPDPDGGPCVFNVKVVDAYVNGSGGMSIKYESCPSGADCPLTECNYFWYHGDGTTQPTPPEPPKPDPPLPPRPEPQPNPHPILDDIKECACAEPPEPPEPDFPVDLVAWQQIFKAVCNYDAQGNPLQVYVNSHSGSKASDALIAIANNQRLLVQVLQQHLDWKTPICSDAKPQLEGRWVSIHFESDGDSPNSDSPLRKLFRYRTQSMRTVQELREYWKDFVWQAGSTCVIHKGATWGTPQVWAASEAEGKRVIQHAGQEAGIDTNTVGEWVVTGTLDPRYGMPGQMRPTMRLGDDWLTSRDGPSSF